MLFGTLLWVYSVVINLLAQENWKSKISGNWANLFSVFVRRHKFSHLSPPLVWKDHKTSRGRIFPSIFFIGGILGIVELWVRAKLVLEISQSQFIPGQPRSAQCASQACERCEQARRLWHLYWSLGPERSQNHVVLIQKQSSKQLRYSSLQVVPSAWQPLCELKPAKRGMCNCIHRRQKVNLHTLSVL